MIFSKKNKAAISGNNFYLSISNFPKKRRDVVKQKLDVYFKSLLQELSDWAENSLETTNFTYDISSICTEYMPTFLSLFCDKDEDELASYITEAVKDQDLITHYTNILDSSIHKTRLDKSLKLARRVGWYAIIRSQKPKVVVESGIDAGIGALAILAAIKKNSDEGFIGKYIGIDISKDAGSLIGGSYEKYSTIIHGDSIESIASLSEQVDIFISDSNHKPEYERKEYNTISSKLSDRAIIIADNAHCTNELLKYSKKMNRKFQYFHEIPVNHWMRVSPAGIGVSYPHSKL